MATNKEVIEAFINNERKNVDSMNVHYYYQSGKLFSYGTCIAQRANSYTIINSTKYSVTTSKHQYVFRRLIKDISNCIEVYNVPRGAENLVYYINE